MNEVPGSLPIEVTQGRRIFWQNHTRHTCTLLLRLALTAEDVDQHQGWIESTLSRLYRQPVTVWLQAGSVVVHMIAAINAAESLDAFRARVGAIDEVQLREELQMDVIILSELSVVTKNIQIPLDTIW